MKLRLNLFYIFLLLSTLSQANTMYTLSGIKKVYPVIEIMTKDVPESYKKMIMEELTQTFDELQLDYSGYDQRSFAILVSSIKVKENSIIIIESLIGEEVRRNDSDKKTFGVTYINKSSFILSPQDDLEDMFDDALAMLLHKFSKQYEEENEALAKIGINEDNFAEEMGYETSYEEAIKKAKKAKKNIMLVVVTNYCPWCRKFEQRVLLQNSVNDLVQKNYIPLIINKEKDILPKNYKIPFSPVVYFIDYKTLKNYETVVGYNNKEEFLYLIKKGK